MDPTTSPTLLEKVCRDAPATEDLDRFVRLYTPVVYAWAKRFKDPEDVTQEVMMRLLTAVRQYRPEEGVRFRHWLRTVVCNRGKDHDTRRGTRRVAGGMPEEVGDRRDPLQEWIDQDDDEYRTGLIRSAMRVVRRQVDEKKWQAFEAVTLGRERATAVADRLGMKRMAVYKANYEMMARIREVIHGFSE